MSLTSAEELRIQAIEEMLNSLQTAVNNLASKQQLRQLLLIRQSEIDALTTRITTLETQIQVLQGSIT